MFEDRSGSARYGMLETVREYARDRLTRGAENEAVRERHTDYFLELAEETNLKLDGPDQAAWHRRLEEEHDNLRSALDWCLKSSERENERRGIRD